MGIRNTEELGINLQKIIGRLMANDELVKLLYYSDKDPYSSPSLTDQEKKELIFEKLIKIVPRMGPKEDAKSVITLRVTGGHKFPGNSEFRGIKIAIEVFVPLTQWIIKDTNLRPFAILGQIEKSLDGKTINGLGKMEGGDFDLNYFTDEVGVYEQYFYITQYE